MDGYFLCVKFSIATMSIATETISCNSSYVLIWHHLRIGSERVQHVLRLPFVKYIMSSRIRP